MHFGTFLCTKTMCLHSRAGEKGLRASQHQEESQDKECSREPHLEAALVLLREISDYCPPFSTSMEQSSTAYRHRIKQFLKDGPIKT